jgi:hypothetical protein
MLSATNTVINAPSHPHPVNHAQSPDQLMSAPPNPKLTTPDARNDVVRVKQAFIKAPPTDEDTPSDFIPGLYILGSTYNVLNGKYAESKSTLQQVVDWNKCLFSLECFFVFY